MRKLNKWRIMKEKMIINNKMKMIEKWRMNKVKEMVINNHRKEIKHQ